MGSVRDHLWEHFRGVQHQLRSRLLPGKKVPLNEPIGREPAGGPWDLAYISLYLKLADVGGFLRIRVSLGELLPPVA